MGTTVDIIESILYVALIVSINVIKTEKNITDICIDGWKWQCRNPGGY